MLKFLALPVIGIALLISFPASADAVTKIYRSKITVYASHDGGGGQKVLERKKIDLPAAVTSERSPEGYVQVRFVLKDAPSNPVRGWIHARDVKLDSRRTLDVGECKPPGSRATVTRGSRGLGDKC